MARSRVNKDGDRVHVGNGPKKTSQGKSSNTRFKSKHHKRNKKKYRGQGTKRRR